MANALKKITTEAKRLKREFPHKFDRSKKPWQKYTQWASERYNTGKIGATKKKKAKKAKPVRKKSRASAPKKRKRASKKRTTAVAVRKTTTKVRVRKVGSPKPTRRRMAGKGNGGGNGLKKLLPVALLVGAGLLLWKAFSPKAPAVPPGAPPLTTTGNQVRNQQSQDIVAYAMAAGMAFDAITKLINSLNQRGDNEVQYIYDELDRGGDLPVTLYA